MTRFSTNTSQATGNSPAPLDSQAPKEMELTQLGRYRLCFELASGGMATVYLARMEGSHGFEKIVALKRIHPHLVTKRSYVEMFLDEARIASGITHPNVCSVFDFGEFDGEYYLAMEYLVGEPLARVCRRAKSNPELRDSPTRPLKMARIIEEACEGLHAAHESRDVNGQPLNVVHRDVSPRNLFMTYSGVVQVVDFGIASAKQRVHRTSTGQLKGTVPYMAPEQVRGGEVDRRVDIWGLGVVLWELLTLDRLFRRETEVESMYAVLVDEIQAPSERRPGIPPELDAIVMKALEREPEKRWRTAREMGQALHAFATNQAEDVGAAELSNWMTELFPEGETRKREIMELALTQTIQARPNVAMSGVEVSGARTMLGDVDAEIAARTQATKADDAPGFDAAATDAPAPDADAKRKWILPAIGLGAVLVPIGVILGLQGSPAPNPVPEPTPRAIDATAGNPAPPVEPASVTPAPANDLPPEQSKLDEAAAETNEVAATKVEPSKTEPSKTTARKRPARKTASRKPRASREQSTPSQAAPAATGLPGKVKIVTKGHSVEIYEGGKLLGRAPALLTLPAGRHKLRLKSTESGETLTLPVNVVANATKTISLDVD